MCLALLILLLALDLGASSTEKTIDLMDDDLPVTIFMYAPPENADGGLSR